jgi:hypothetical protein
LRRAEYDTIGGVFEAIYFFKFAFAFAFAFASAVAVVFAPAFAFTHTSPPLGTFGVKCTQTKNSRNAPHLIPYSARKGQIGGPP